MPKKSAEPIEKIEKRKYVTPGLVTYGGLRELTQNGTAATNENNGKGFCGNTYNRSGSASC